MRELGASSLPLSQPVVQDGVEMDPGYEATSRSIWPSIYPALLELVRAHRSTIVFVNNRRLAERLAALASTSWRGRTPKAVSPRSIERLRGRTTARSPASSAS